MQIENNLTLLTSILKSGDTIVIPSDGVWGLCCDARDDKAVARINAKIQRQADYFEEIIVANLQMLKEYAFNLHPRVETLLVHHERPVRIKCRQELIKKDHLYMRIVKDKVSQILLSEINFPLYFVSFFDKENCRHLSLNEIRTQDHERISFIASQTENIEYTPSPLLKLEFDEEGMITILS